MKTVWIDLVGKCCLAWRGRDYVGLPPHRPRGQHSISEVACSIVTKSLLALACASVLALSLSGASAVSQELGTAEEAKAMLERAIAALKSNRAIALTAFNDPDNKQFHDRDLHVSCFGAYDGKITAGQGLIGIDIRTLSFEDDPIGQRAYDAIQNSPTGTFQTVEYNFPKPKTKLAVPMQLLEIRVDNDACGVSYYK